VFLVVDRPARRVLANQCFVCGARLLAGEVGERICEFCRPYSGLPPRPSTAAVTSAVGGPDWATFRMGLAFLSAFTILTLFLLLGAGRAGQALGDHYGLLLVLVVIQTGLGLSGLALLLGIPSAVELRGRVWAMFGCVLLLVLAPLLEVDGPHSRIRLLIIGMIVLFGIIGFVICFASVLSGAARHLGDIPLANRIIAFFVSLSLTCLGLVLAGFVAQTLVLDSHGVEGHHSLGETVNAMMGLVMIALAGFSVWFLGLLGQLRRAMS
jgi:hypothetical protein